MSARPDAPWPPPPRSHREIGTAIHVWSLRLDRARPRLTALERLLASEEREKAGRFRFAIDRERFIARRGLLRTILGDYLELMPESLVFGEAEHGKPYLMRAADERNLRFNVSHSSGLALLAVTEGREVGVDVERVRPDVLEDDIPERFFSPREVAALRSLAQPDQIPAFFRCWARKEAYIKALGTGLQLPLDSFDVSLGPGEPAALLGTRPDPTQASRWSMQTLCVDPAYAAALVVEQLPRDPHGSLHCWSWPD
jgi:4'-phosphopantetheinyl transferase